MYILKVTSILTTTQLFTDLKGKLINFLQKITKRIKELNIILNQSPEIQLYTTSKTPKTWEL